MKEVSAEILNATAAEKSWTSVFADLVKARLTTLVLLTTLVGFYLGWHGAMNYALMLQHARRHGAGRGRRVGVEPVARTRIRRKNAPHAKPSAAVGTVAADDRHDFWRREFGRRFDLSRARGQSAHERSRRGHPGQLSVHLYAAQTRDVVEYGDWRGARRVAAADGLDGGARRIERRRLGVVRDFIFLAAAAFFCHRVDVSG